jgi:hypothetical protein
MIKKKLFQKTNFKLRRLLKFKAIRHPGFFIGGVIIFCILILALFPDPFINLLLKDRVSIAFNEAYPKDTLKLGRMHYNFWKNTLGCDSVILKTNNIICRIPSFSVSGIGFTTILMQKNFTPTALTSLKIDAQNVEIINRQSQDEFRLGRLHISIPDSEIVTDSIKYYSLSDDEQFFAKSKFRQTRYRIDIPQIQIMSLDCLALLQGNGFIAKNFIIHDAFADILVNMDKPYNKNSPNPNMPNEEFASIKEIFKLDSLNIINGRLKYSERFEINSKPGIISINKITISAGEIANQKSFSDTTIIHGEGILMNSTKINVSIAIPFNSKDFSLHYSGSVGSMDVTELNSFIEPGEHQRIKTGYLQSASFTITVNSGKASGTLNAKYKDLKIDVINKNTGSENGIFDRIASLFNKMFVVRGTNMPDGKGLIKTGEIKYARDPEDYFFQFIWFAVRNGIADVVGFPKK